MITAYIAAGNSDDRLTQKAWAEYSAEIARVTRLYAVTIHGEWFSVSNSQYQNMCICAVLDPDSALELREALSALRKNYQQDSIAFATTSYAEMI